MNTLTLELSDEVYTKLQKQARKAHTSVETFIAENLSRQYVSDYEVKTFSRDEILHQRQRFSDLLKTYGEPNIDDINRALQAREQVAPETDLDESVKRKLRSKMSFKTDDEQ